MVGERVNVGAGLGSDPVTPSWHPACSWNGMHHRFLLAAALALTVGVRADGLPLVVGKVTLGPSSQVELKNTGNKAVTAWSLGILTHPDSSRTHKVIQT